MSNILDGNKVVDALTPDLIEKIGNLRVKPTLVIIQIGDLAESNTFIAKKKAYAKKIGAEVIHAKYEENVSEEVVRADIQKYNSDPTIHGIMVQLPIPAHLDTHTIIESINTSKDVEGITAHNTKLLFDNQESFVPAATQGILALFKYYEIPIDGKKVTIVGESSLVGRPTALAFLNRKATVSVCHSHTQNLEKETKNADILIVAVGKPNLITINHVSAKQIIIDVGINVIEDKRVVGDVDFENLKDIVGAITPVPGGVGPMTVYALFDNLIKAADHA